MPISRRSLQDAIAAAIATEKQNNTSTARIASPRRLTQCHATGCCFLWRGNSELGDANALDEDKSCRPLMVRSLPDSSDARLLTEHSTMCAFGQALSSPTKKEYVCLT